MPAGPEPGSPLDHPVAESIASRFALPEGRRDPMTHSVYGPGASGVAPPPMRLLDRLVHALLPATCLGCGQPLPVRGSALGLCGACRGLLSHLPAQACAVCALPLGEAYALPAGYRCGACRQAPPAFDRMLALW